MFVSLPGIEAQEELFKRLPHESYVAPLTALCPNYVRRTMP